MTWLVGQILAAHVDWSRSIRRSGQTKVTHHPFKIEISLNKKTAFRSGAHDALSTQRT